MRILFVAPYVPSPIRVRPYHFVRQLGRHHEVTVLAVGGERDVRAAAELRGICRTLALARPSAAGTAKNLALAALRGDPLQSAVCYSDALRARMQQLLQHERFDVVHIEHLRAARLHTVVPADVPTVFDAVDSISLLLERTLRASHSFRQRLIAALELRRTRRYEARLLRRFERVVITSSDDAAAMRRLEPTANVSVVPNGVDLEQFRLLDEPPDPATLVFSGKMSYHANVSAVLHFVRDIMPIVRARRADVRLRIVGSKPPSVIRALARDPAICVTGDVQDMRHALVGATIAICPVTVKVGIQNKVLEAMALGLPVVCSAAGAHGIDAVPGRDFLVANSAVEFADMIDQLLGCPALRTRVGLSSRRFVERHHRWDSAAAQLTAVYESVARHPRERAA